MGPEARRTAVRIRKRERPQGSLHTHRDGHMKTQERRKALGHIKPTDALTLDFQPQELLSKPPSLWFLLWQPQQTNRKGNQLLCSHLAKL